jgi:hypothetical protein
MNVRKVKIQTVHGIKRIKERTDLSRKTEALKLIKKASQRGASIHSFKAYKRFYRYLINRAGFDKRVKVYAGYVFIFNGGSNRLITMYPIPERFKEEMKNAKQ